MKIKPAFLFLILALVGIALGAKSSILPLFVATLSCLTSLFYLIMAKLGKPISDRTGYWHFGLTTLGLFLSINLLSILLTPYNSSSTQDLSAFSSDVYFIIMNISGILLLLAGLVVFIVGSFRAIKHK